MKWIWYELLPSPDGAADDQDRFLKRARRASAELGLSERPGIADIGHLGDDGCILLARGGRRWLAVAETHGDRAAEAVARAAKAVARGCDPPDFLDERLPAAHAFVPISATLSRTARDDETDDSDVRLDAPEDGWVAFNVRRIGYVEGQRNDDWLADEFNRQADTSKLRGEGVGVCRVVAAAPTFAQARDHAKLAANSLGLGLAPGFSAHRSRPRAALCAVGVAVFAGALAVFAAGGPWWPAIPAALFAAAAFWRRLSCPSDEALWQRPRHRWWFRRTRTARVADRKTLVGGDEAGPWVRKRINGYAFQRSSMPLPAGALAGVATPSALSQASRTAKAAAPEALKGDGGPNLGRDGGDEMASLAPEALYGGVGILGEPGSGKSNLMHGLEHWGAAHAGPGDVLVAIESKGQDSLPVLRRLIPSMLVIDVSDPSTPMIDLLGPGTPMDRANNIADLMQRALGEGQVGQQSRIQLRDSVFVALTALPAPSLARQCAANGVKAPSGWTGFASRLLASEGVSDARALGLAACAATDNPDVRAAVERLHGGTNAAGRPAIPDGQLMQRLSAPMNKMDLLARAPELTARRPSVTWRQVVANHAILAVNIGPAAKTGPDGAHAAMPDGTRRLVGALLFQSLRDEIERSCAGWQDSGRRVRLYIDELTDVSGGDDGREGGGSAAIRWLRERGRAYGVELVAGTQNPSQMDPSLLATFLGLMTLCCFTLRASKMAQTVADEMGCDPQAIRSLNVHDMAVRTVDRRLSALAPFVLTVPHFDAGDGLDAVRDA